MIEVVLIVVTLVSVSVAVVAWHRHDDMDDGNDNIKRGQ